MKQEPKIRFGLRGAAFLLLFLLIQPVLAAERPELNLVANWTPTSTLDSVDVNNDGIADNGVDDFRYVDVQLLAQGNVQFWAVDLSCTVGRGTELEFVSINFPPNVWGDYGTNMAVLPSPTANTGDGTMTYADPTVIYNGDGRGTLAVTPTRLGFNTAPLGVNGTAYTLVLANVRFRVLPQNSSTSVSINCRTIDFLDRNGDTVFRGRQTRTSNLEVLPGYVLNGSATRQGSRDASNIEVTCTNYPDGYLTPGTANTYPAILTDRSGNFTFDQDGGAELRALGYYECDFISKSDGATIDEVYLTSSVSFLLRTPEYSLYPVMLRTGNVDDGDGLEQVDFVNDLALLTSNYGSSYSNPFDPGDVNGDRRVDDADLAVTAGNIGLDGPLATSHILYGLGRDFSADELFPFSQLWWGFPGEGATFPLISRSRTRDFWPMLSPDGSQVAYIGVAESRGTLTYSLNYLDTERGRTTSVRFPREFTDSALAPSWSPDGSRIAFICTPRGNENGDPELEGYLYNSGDICVMNSDDTRGDTLFNLGVNSEIFPPAWLEYDAEAGAGYVPGYMILYPDFETGKIRYYDLSSNTEGQVDVNAGGSDVLDMPVVVTYAPSADVDADTSNLGVDTYLVYRYSDGGDPYVKVGSISFDPSTFTFGGTITGAHVSLDTETTGVDYFDVSPSLDIMFYYEYNYALANTLPPFAFNILPHDDDTPLTWGAVSTYLVDSVVGNPISVLATGGGGLYNPGLFPGNPTELHANRMTFDMIP